MTAVQFEVTAVIRTIAAVTSEVNHLIFYLKAVEDRVTAVVLMMALAPFTITARIF